MRWLKLPLLFLIFLTFFLLIFKNYLSSKVTHFFLSQKKPINELESTEYLNKILNLSGKYDYSVKTAFFEGRKIPIPETLATLPLDASVLGLKAYAVSQEKRIEIDLDNQKLYAKEGDQVVYEFPISSGFPWTPTVTGEFKIWSKLKYTRMAGGCEINDCYDLPNVPYTQYFYKGYAFHGAYWHNDFGRPRSHGCVNLKIPDAEKLYYWTSPFVPQDRWGINSSQDNPGTKIIIYGKARVQ